MDGRVRVILITDGDDTARAAVEQVARDLGLRCISASAGNPTPISGAQIVNLLRQVKHDPVLIMFDDQGEPASGPGEQALKFVAAHPGVEVLGAVAVASNADDPAGVRADKCINAAGELVDSAVNKYGDTVQLPLLRGDTVAVLNQCAIPIIIGIGDIGKMREGDAAVRGAPITRRAVEKILAYNGWQQEG